VTAPAAKRAHIQATAAARPPTRPTQSIASRARRVCARAALIIEIRLPLLDQHNSRHLTHPPLSTSAIIKPPPALAFIACLSSSGCISST